MAPVFSFIIPTRGNPESVVRLFDSIASHTQRPDEVEIVLVIDTDDEQSRSLVYPGLNICKVEGPPRRSMGALNMAGYRAATGQYVALLNDDVIIRTPSWDDYVIDVFRNYPDGIVLAHVNDTIFRERLCTFPFLTRGFCELAGGISDEGYLRYRIDDHIHNVFDLLDVLGYRRRVYLPDVIFEHLNLTRTEEGSTYVVDSSTHAMDTRRFEELFSERKRLALSAAELIDRYAQSQKRRVRESNLEAVPACNDIPDPVHTRWRPTEKPPRQDSRVTLALLSADMQSDQACKCIEKVKAHTADYELVIVDSNRESGLNRAREVNRLLEFCRTDYLVVMDDDILVGGGWLDGLIRAMGPGVGVVTPTHIDQAGAISYAGIVMQPDDSGNYSHVLGIGALPQYIQTLSGAIMLVDRNRCGHVRFDEGLSEYFRDIDYGLRIWEEGCRVVCTPWTRVTLIGGGTPMRGIEQPENLFEADRFRWQSTWAETHRIHELRRGVWQDIPEFIEMSAIKLEIDTLFREGTGLPRDDLFKRARPLIDTLDSLPALKNYVAAKARAALPEGTARADDPRTGTSALLLGLAGEPVVYEAGPEEMNIVLWNARFYVLPAGEDLLDPSQGCSFDADTPEEVRDWIAHSWNGFSSGTLLDTDQPLPEPQTVKPLAPGVVAALKRLGRTLPYLNSVRPRILIGRGGNLFDRDYYRAAYPDVASRGINPLLHFLICGAFEGRNPHPLFDTAFYLRCYPDVAKAKVNPLGHYLKYGASESRQPHPLFDTAYYLECYPDVRKSKMNPLVHYVLYGAAEGRQPHAWFQPNYYLDHCGERERAVRNPLIHFLQSDSNQCGAPHPQFDCEYYLRQNPSVVVSGMNPLVHYVLFGARAGRRTRAASQSMNSAQTVPSASRTPHSRKPLSGTPTPLSPASDVKHSSPLGDRLVQTRRSPASGNLQVEVEEEPLITTTPTASVNPAAPVHVVIVHGQINDQHGTGALVKRVFRNRSGIFSIRFHDDWGIHDFGDWHTRLLSEPSDHDQSLRQVRRVLEGRNVKTVTCVPFTGADLRTAVAIKEAFGAKLCVWIMDDQNIAVNSIADSVMEECLRAASLRLMTHPELRDAYQEKYRLPAYILPAVVPAHLIRRRPEASTQDGYAARAALLGSFWDQSWFDRLCSALEPCDWSTDWYGQNKSPWLRFSQAALATAHITALGIVPEDQLAEELSRYPFVIVPAGALDDQESNTAIASLSLPGRILFAAATSHTPVLLVGSDKSCGARFVRHFGIGAVAPYEAHALHAASAQLRDPETQRLMRKNAAALGAAFSDDGVVDWLSTSTEWGRPADSRFEDAFSGYDTTRPGSS